MEIFQWFYQLAVPLLGWWLLTKQLQAWSLSYQKNLSWGADFQRDFLRSWVCVLLFSTPENLRSFLKTAALPMRVRLLWIALRSLSYGVLFLTIFAVWNFVPTPILLLLAVAFFIASRWWKALEPLVLGLFGLGIFIFGFEELTKVSSRWMDLAESPAWIYGLATNFLPGALIGLVGGVALRVVFRLSGVATWAGLNLLLSGILSLGGAWGFFLGDVLASALEDWFIWKNREFRLRLLITLIFSAVFLLLTTPFQSVLMNWINGQYSTQLRSIQLGTMIFLFLLLESAFATGFFHFYYAKRKVD